MMKVSLYQVTLPISFPNTQVIFSNLNPGVALPWHYCCKIIIITHCHVIIIKKEQLIVSRNRIRMKGSEKISKLLTYLSYVLSDCKTPLFLLSDHWEQDFDWEGNYWLCGNSSGARYLFIHIYYTVYILHTCSFRFLMFAVNCHVVEHVETTTHVWSCPRSLILIMTDRALIHLVARFL